MKIITIFFILFKFVFNNFYGQCNILFKLLFNYNKINIPCLYEENH